MGDYIALDGRKVVRITGAERASFLDRLVTNKVIELEPGQIRYAALLTPQGKYLYDFFVLEGGDHFLVDVNKDQAEALLRRLTMYKLRADVAFEETELNVYAVLGEPKPEEDIVVTDPRHEGLGWRVYAHNLPASGDRQAYETRRLELGIPDLPADALAEKTLSLEANLDILNGVDFAKGCYVGQELTARMKYRGKVRKRLIPISCEGILPPPGTDIRTVENKSAGEVRSGSGGMAMAVLRLEDLDKTPLSADGVIITAHIPDSLGDTA